MFNDLRFLKFKSFKVRNRNGVKQRWEGWKWPMMRAYMDINAGTKTKNTRILYSRNRNSKQWSSVQNLFAKSLDWHPTLLHHHAYVPLCSWSAICIELIIASRTNKTQLHIVQAMTGDECQKHLRYWQHTLSAFRSNEKLRVADVLSIRLSLRGYCAAWCMLCYVM